MGFLIGSQNIRLAFEKRALKSEVEVLRRNMLKINEIEDKLSRMEKIETYLKTILTQGIDTELKLYADPSGLPGQYFSSSELENVKDRELFIPRGLPQQGAITMLMGQKRQATNAPHIGIDISLSEGKPVFATAAGRIITAGFDPDYGYNVSIDHLNGYVTKYGHLMKLSVKSGALIRRNAIIGLTGSTGKSTAPHYHYEITKDGKPVDPKEYMKPKEETIKKDNIQGGEKSITSQKS